MRSRQPDSHPHELWVRPASDFDRIQPISIPRALLMRTWLEDRGGTVVFGLELTAAADLYDQITGTTPHADEEIEATLAKLRQLDSSTAYPLVLKLMGRMRAQQIAATEFIECVEFLSGFIFRRYICGETSRPYSKWFVAACKEVSGEHPREGSNSS